jgi:hypothetical protein
MPYAAPHSVGDCQFTVFRRIANHLEALSPSSSYRGKKPRSDLGVRRVPRLTGVRLDHSLHPDQAWTMPCADGPNYGEVNE